MAKQPDTSGGPGGGGRGRFSQKVLEAAVRAVRPRYGPYDVPVDERVAAACLSFMAYLPPAVRMALPFGLVLLEWSPLLFGFGMRRFSRLDGERATAYWERLLRAPAPLSSMAAGLRALVLLCFYEQPEILSALGVRWRERAEELVERRARLLEMPEELANPRNAAGGRR